VATLVALLLRCGLVTNAEVLAAIVSVESGGNPLALAVNGDFKLVRQPRDLGEAVAMARWLAEHGHSFDAGLAQVNSANLARLGLDAASVFDTCTNLRAASRVLEECLERASQRWRDPRWRMAAAVSCYNTGHLTRGIANGYVEAVRAAGAPLGSSERPGRRVAAPAARGGRSTLHAVSAARPGQRVPGVPVRADAFAAPPTEAFRGSRETEQAP
jgi:type IV secretion system protein VirB1